MTLQVVRAADHRSVPWKNGGGTTVEIAVSPGTPFLWRASLARVEADGPFSDFTGYDRWLVLLDGPGMTLTFPDGDRILERPLRPFPFDGGTPVRAALRGGPTTDWNWIVDRSRAEGTVILVERPGMTSGIVWFALGPAEVTIRGKRIRLERHDAVVDPGRALGTFDTGGPLLVADARARIPATRR
ncbi:MAG: HutD family protein [Deltaproteobacteria bacterium]|nr:HutD family protein [Deltaproteobacteria bacterium]